MNDAMAVARRASSAATRVNTAASRAARPAALSYAAAAGATSASPCATYRASASDAAAAVADADCAAACVAAMTRPRVSLSRRAARAAPTRASTPLAYSSVAAGRSVSARVVTMRCWYASAGSPSLTLPAGAPTPSVACNCVAVVGNTRRRTAPTGVSRGGGTMVRAGGTAPTRGRAPGRRASCDAVVDAAAAAARGKPASLAGP